MTHTDFTQTQSKNAADRFLVANDTDEVYELINEIEAKTDTEWIPLAKDEGNYSAVYGQAASPMPCFVEIAINSEDAIGIRFFESSTGPEIKPDTYKTLREAVDAFVDKNDASVEIIADGTIPQAKQIPNPNMLNLTVRDNGCGQPQDEFEDTFLGIHKPGLIKQQYGFTQGRFGMGSTGVLQFCGNINDEYNDRCFKFIASASHRDPGKWSWSIIRDNQRLGRFEYLRINGEIPRFTGTFGDSMRQKIINSSSKYNRQEDIEVFEPQEFGTFVKMYDYQTNCSRSQINSSDGFRPKLERYLVNSPLEITITEARYPTQKVVQARTKGFLPRLAGKENLLVGEEIDVFKCDFESEILGTRPIQVALFKHTDDLENTNKRGKDEFLKKGSRSDVAGTRTGIQTDHAVMITINGQTHGSLGTVFLRQCGFSKVADDTVVIVELDDFANGDLIRMFRPSRDDLKEGMPIAQRFLAGLETALKKSDLLLEEEDRRRSRRGSSKELVTRESFEKFLNRHPTLVNYLDFRQKVAAPYFSSEDGTETPLPKQDDDEAQIPETRRTTEGDGETVMESLRLPTYITPIAKYDPDGEHIYWESPRPMPLDIPVNAGKQVRFATDAQSNYLVRDILSGELKVSPSEMFRSVELHDGILTVTLKPYKDPDPGDSHPVTVELTRPSTAEIRANAAYIDFEATEIETDGGGVDTGSEEVFENPLVSYLDVRYKPAVNRPPRKPWDDIVHEEDRGDGTGDEDTDGRIIDDEASSAEASAETATPDTTRKRGMPSISYVYRADWEVDPDVPEEDWTETQREFDEHTLLRIEPSIDGSVSGLHLTINRDAAVLRSFIVEENIRDGWKKFVEQQYELALVFFSICDYLYFQESFDDQVLATADFELTDIVETSVNGLSQALMPMLINDDQLTRISE
ncbi:hypothetical protein [Haloferax sulfurifontis]|uniref:Uncharacterized protein n=1 Tax=Haloferax sulfurifontis ATCC BAA-897 TaxID=662480 RepID=M0I2Y7_9EURY|nr:hypothetical protein [Haloferax sulfurifontis]ELZ91145.1 hypothetical protein C441_12460 [Haloferax sulfurifontis ATCC BAA-897]